MSAYIAECVGTAILVLLGNGVVANVSLAKTKGSTGGWICVTAGWAFAVAVGAYAASRISGAHLNPAVTIALSSIGAFSWSMVPGYIIAQMLGGFIGAVLVYLSYLAHWGETSDQASKLACFSTAPAIRRMWPAFITETIGTALLLFGILVFGKVALGASSGQEAWAAVLGAWFGPAVVGMLIFAIGLSLGGPSGYAINPARDLAPRIAHAVLPIPGKGPSDWKYAPIPVFAPILGGILGANLFVLLGF